jgi:hypothetical protein
MKAILFALLLIIVSTRAAEADTWEGNFCGAHRSAILELQSHSRLRKIFSNHFLKFGRGQLPPAGVPIVGGTNEQKITRG